MDAMQFARWTRRRFGFSVAGVAGSLLPVVDAPRPTTAGTRKKHKPKKNAYGCLNVGKPCRGKDRDCCSGRCDGKKPGSGEKDRSRCVAHHVGTCTPALDDCVSSVGTACNPDLPFAVCYRTTGKASFCGNAVVGGCIECRDDRHCESIGFPKGSACVVCPSCEGGEGTACISPGAP